MKEFKNSKEISFHKHTIQQLEGYVQSKIPSLASTMVDGLQRFDTQLTELKINKVNLCGKVNNLRNLIDQDMASLKKELKELKVNSCLCECNNIFKLLCMMHF